MTTPETPTANIIRSNMDHVTTPETPTAKAETPAVKAARERFEALKGKSNKMSEDRAELARYSELENTERKRLDDEGQEALKQEAHIREAEAWAALSPDVQARTSIECVYDWTTHKVTGRGIIVFHQLDPDSAAAAMRPSVKVNSDGLALFDNSPETQVKNLVKAALYPDPGDVQLICDESPIFASLAHQKLMDLSGMGTCKTVGKSRG